jgi:hypothetical protein
VLNVADGPRELRKKDEEDHLAIGVAQQISGEASVDQLPHSLLYFGVAKRSDFAIMTKRPRTILKWMAIQNRCSTYRSPTDMRHKCSRRDNGTQRAEEVIFERL